MGGPAVVGSLFSKLLGAASGNIGDTVVKIASIWKVPPEVVLQNQTEIRKITEETAQATIASATAEIQSAADVIKAEAQSQSWLPRNVRPLLLLLWGSAITFNVVVTVFVHCFKATIQPIALDPWVYKLTAIGYTGYVSWRSVEKLTDKDN